MAWYSAGTVSVTNNSATVTGSGTAWVANAQASEGIWLPDGRLYEIVSINSDTSLTISPNYLGTSQSGQVYRIVPVKGYPLLAAQQMAALISTVQGYVDGALSGRFGDGTVGAPGVSFASNPAMGLYRVAANQLGFATNGVRRMLLTNSSLEINVNVLGTAVQADNQDISNGNALLRVGSFGLGATGGIPAPGNDANQCLVPAFNYRFSTSWANCPVPNPYGATLHVFRGTGESRVQQLFLHSNGKDIYFRESSDTGATYTPWTKQLNEKDIEYGSNANGEYVKFPDGTMICTHEVDISDIDCTQARGSVFGPTGTMGTFPFPASFVGSPALSVDFLGSDNVGIRNNFISAYCQKGRPREAVTAWQNLGLTTAISLSTGTDASRFKLSAIGRWKN